MGGVRSAGVPHSFFMMPGRHSGSGTKVSCCDTRVTDRYPSQAEALDHLSATRSHSDTPVYSRVCFIHVSMIIYTDLLWYNKIMEMTNEQ